MFAWLRAKVRNAILAGINDAVELVERQGANDNDEAPRELEERIRLLPAPEEVKSKRSRSA